MPSALRFGIPLCMSLLSTLPIEAARANGLSNDPEHCLAMALYWEARAEGRRGMEAVAAVVLNRVAHPEFPDQVCAVVTEGGESPPCQFSWWCDGKSDRPAEAGAWAEAREVAQAALAAPAADRTQGALFFHTSEMATPWRRARTRTVQIGEHVFYR